MLEIHIDNRQLYMRTVWSSTGSAREGKTRRRPKCCRDGQPIPPLLFHLPLACAATAAHGRGSCSPRMTSAPRNCRIRAGLGWPGGGAPIESNTPPLHRPYIRSRSLVLVLAASDTVTYITRIGRGCRLCWRNIDSLELLHFAVITVNRSCIFSRLRIGFQQELFFIGTVEVGVHIHLLIPLNRTSIELHNPGSEMSQVVKGDR